MKKITKPTVKVLASGNRFKAKQMRAKEGDLLPQHLANVESMLLVQEGECILNMNDEDHLLKQGDAFVVPPDTKHQIKAKTDFKAAHFMPNEIEFKFYQ